MLKLPLSVEMKRTERSYGLANFSIEKDSGVGFLFTEVKGGGRSLFWNPLADSIDNKLTLEDVFLSNIAVQEY